MLLTLCASGPWYHGSDRLFSLLAEGSTITQWRALAEAFSHKPPLLGYGEDGSILHTGLRAGYLYVIDEPVALGQDVYPHPHTTMDPNAEFLTRRPLKVRMIAQLAAPSAEEQAQAQRQLDQLMAQLQGESGQGVPSCGPTPSH